MENQNKRILIVDDNEELLKALKLFLNPHFKYIITERNPNIIPKRIAENFDVILLDMNFSAGINNGNEGFYWLNRILSHDPMACVVFITAFSDVELAVQAMKKGATDFIQKSWDESKILSTILSAYKIRQSKLKITQLKNQQKHLSENISHEYPLIKGDSEKMNEVYKIIEKVSSSDANILIQGENGTGKEVIAREIHRQSNRKKEIFLSVDLGAISENLFESELFGHVKGAFTDAINDRIGRFELAMGGTLFLDEIGNLPFSLQSKLLSAIQNNEITRVGSTQSIPIDFRLICASNKNLYQMIENLEFREDLLYRINTISIDLPPLRDRKEDISALADYFLNLYSEKYNKEKMSFSDSAISKLMQHYWHGNIRELQHSIEKAVIMSDGNKLKPLDFFLNKSSQINNKTPDNFNLAENEKKLIKKAIEQCKGNLSLTSKTLGINRSTLYDKIKKYEI